MNRLLHLPYSPWSERARWALDLRDVPYRRVTYQPIFGEPRLRLALRRLRGPVSVPVLFTDDAGVLADSFAIARFADAHGRGAGPRLFPDGSDAVIAGYNQASERALAAGRALALRRIQASDDALLELVPRALRRPLGRGAVAVSRAAVGRTLRKYGGDRQSIETARATLREILGELRRDLSGRPTLLDGFSYADVTMAQALVFVAPPTTDQLRIAPANRAAFADAELAAEFADLVAWRDALYVAWRDALNLAWRDGSMSHGATPAPPLPPLP
jgi:glutathione S-transferase